MFSMNFTTFVDCQKTEILNSIKLKDKSQFGVASHIQKREEAEWPYHRWKVVLLLTSAHLNKGNISNIGGNEKGKVWLQKGC